MLPELGLFALILALILSALQITIPLWGTYRHQQSYIQLAKPLAFTQSIFVIISFFILMYGFVANDFSIAYVAENSNSFLPLFYRMTAVWGAHEGSMLLWVTVLGIWTIAVCLFSKALPDEMRARVLAVLGMISFGFLLFILQTSNPFLRVLPNIPVQGQDLNPLLQDPGLISHPPMLYMGYVGFSVAFAFAIAALLSGRLDATWAKWTRPWTLAAWSFLTLGITLGSWWSYRVLGWGGWWFWDPVENASFLPWLTGTALIHSLAVCEKRGAFKSWTVLLAISAFSLSLMGTFLVRSGILTSVHAFAVDPTRGAFILKFLTIVIGGSLFLYAWRASSVKGSSNFNLLSRETMLLSNNVILMVAMITVLLGTLFPLMLQALNIDKISIGAPYFNTVFIPLVIPLFFVMGVGPVCQWQQMPMQELYKKLRLLFFVTIILAIIIPFIFAGSENWRVVLGLALALWIVGSNFKELFTRIKILGGFKNAYAKIPNSFWGMTIAHVGLAVCIIGITMTTAYSIERDVRMSVGDTAALGNFQFQFKSIQGISGPNYQGAQAEFILSKKDSVIARLFPEKRIYARDQMSTSVAAIDAGIFRDLYVVLGEPFNNTSWAVRIYDKPFVRWIWFGGIIMMVGGMVSVCDRRYKK